MHHDDMLPGLRPGAAGAFLAGWLLAPAAHAAPDPPVGAEPTAAEEPPAPGDAEPGAEPPAEPEPAGQPPAPEAEVGAEPAAAPEPAPPDSGAAEPKAAEPKPAKASGPEPPAKAKPDKGPTKREQDRKNDGKKKKRNKPDYPRLVIAGGPALGPHTTGVEECLEQDFTCDRGGTFLGLGLNVEVRARVWKFIYAHARALAVGNVTQKKPVYAALLAPGAGLGVYSRFVFLRAEYMLTAALGRNEFRPPFVAERTGSDTWAYSAGLFSVGVRHKFRPRLAGELWAGVQVGPRAKRVVPNQPDENRTMISFVASIGVSYDIIK